MITRTEQDFRRAVVDNDSNGLEWGSDAYRMSSNFIGSIEMLVDIGANVGGFTIEALKHFPGMTAYLFEPAKALADVCSSRFSGNKNIKVSQTALSDTNGSTIFFQNVNKIGGGSLALELHGSIPFEEFIETHVGNSEGMQAVPQQTIVQRLDDAVSGKVDLIKIDVEGAEFLVLRGAMRTIIEYRPVIILEVSYGRLKHPRWAEEVAAIEDVIALGYEIIVPSNELKVDMNNPCFDQGMDVVLVPISGPAGPR